MVAREGEVLVNFHTRPEVLKKLKELALRENSSIKSILNTLIEDYIKVHGEGNPAYPLDAWVKNPEMKAWPAFDKQMEYWTSYLSKCEPKEAFKIMEKANAIGKMARNYASQI